jgi:iron complex transport system ATP-binding protein
MSNIPLFQVDELTFSYPGTPVLNGLSATLSAGKFYGIIGPNGCGKTTLLDLFTGAKTPQTGSILFRGQPIGAYRKRVLAQQLALVPQEFNTGFGFTVEEIVMMGRHPHIGRFAAPAAEDWELVEQAMDDIGIKKLRHRLLTSLSGGQKQRAVVARALAQNTPVLLFDEATASLDIKYSLHIFQLARNLVNAGQRTIIAVIHDLNLAAAYCDHLIFLDRGTIVANGPTEDILTAELIDRIFNVSSKIGWDEYSGCLQVQFAYRNEKP